MKKFVSGSAGIQLSIIGKKFLQWKAIRKLVCRRNLFVFKYKKGIQKNLSFY
jgi:hypothetical protein